MALRQAALFFAGSGLICAAATTAAAQPTQAVDDRVIVQCEPGDVVTGPIPVPRNRVSTVRAEQGLDKGGEGPKSMDLGVLGVDVLAVHPEEAVGTTFSVDVFIDGVQAALWFLVVPDTPEQPSQFMIVPRAVIEARDAEKRARANAMQERDREWLIDQARRLDETNTRYYPVIEPETETTDPVSVRVLPAKPAGRGSAEWLLVPIELTGREPGETYRLVSAEVWDSASEKQLDAEVVLVDGEPPGSEGMLTVVTARDTARVVFSVRAENPGQISPLRVVLRRAGADPIVAKVPRWSLAPLPPLTREEMREIMRKREERARKAKEEADRIARDRELAKRTWIGVHGLYGAIWLDDGLPMTEDTDATSLVGFGVRVSKGLIAMERGPTPLLSVEVDVAGAASGTARFEDVTIDGMQGQLGRTAKLGRVQVGAVLRLGDKVIPTLRAGLGGQGISQDSELETAGGPVSVLDSSFEVTEMLYVGGGVDLRFGSGFIGGIGLTLINSGGRRSLEGGLHLGYGLGS